MLQTQKLSDFSADAKELPEEWGNVKIIKQFCENDCGRPTEMCWTNFLWKFCERCPHELSQGKKLSNWIAKQITLQSFDKKPLFRRKRADVVSSSTKLNVLRLSFSRKTWKNYVKRRQLLFSRKKSLTISIIWKVPIVKITRNVANVVFTEEVADNMNVL